MILKSFPRAPGERPFYERHVDTVGHSLFPTGSGVRRADISAIQCSGEVFGQHQVILRPGRSADNLLVDGFVTHALIPV